MTKISVPFTFQQTCPDGSSPTDVKVIVESVFNEQTFELGSTEIVVSPSQQNSISVIGVTNEGSFSVSYRHGIADEADAEIMSRKPSGLT